MSNSIYCQSLFQEIIDCQAAISRANDYAAGVLLGDLRKLLKEYATADMVIFRCPIHGTYWLSDSRHASVYCKNNPVFPIERLLSDGTWQSEAERNQENLVRLERIMK